MRHLTKSGNMAKKSFGYDKANGGYEYHKHICKKQNQQELILQHAEMIMNAAEKTFSEKRDLEDMKERFTSLKKSG
jgi:hypothetical protein